MRLEGKTAIVTGAGSGIGRAVAQLFSAEGAVVALFGRRREKLEETASLCDGRAIIVPGDVTRESDRASLVETVHREKGALHILVNNAAVLFAGTAMTQSEEDWDAMFHTNVKAVWRLSRTAVPVMRASGGGSIVNIASVLGLVGARDRIGYAASKGAVVLMTKAMALDHAEENIRVNCICPGIVETEMVAGFITQAPDPEAARSKRIGLHPLGRFGAPVDVAAMALYLASDESTWVTGAAFPLDGGYTAR